MLTSGESTRFGRVRQPDKETQARLAMLKLQIDNTNQKYYLQYRGMRLQEEAANKLLTCCCLFSESIR